MKFLQKKKKNDKGKNKLGQDDDEITIRMRVREFVEGKIVTTLMTCVTIFALFGDDFRLWFFESWIDPYFYAVLILCLVLFALEILLNSCVVDDFKYSFFFWLDIVATLSLIVDIAWIVSAIETLVNMKTSMTAADVTLGEKATGTADSDKIAKVIKSLRLIRLIRIIKLYKYVVQSNSEAEEARLREQQKLSQNAQQAALKRELEPSRLGKALSDTLTRRLIIGVLMLLMVLPAITYQGNDISF